MTHEKGMFGRARIESGKWLYGFYQDKENGVEYILSVDNKGDTYARGLIDFTPCYDPLPLEPTFKEWATFMMGQMPCIIKIETRLVGDVILFNRDMWLHTGKLFPSEPNQSYTRADLFPEPEAKPALKTLGAVLDFCLNNDELSNEEMTAMLEAEGFDIGRFLPEALKAIKKVLDPAKLGEKE